MTRLVRPFRLLIAALVAVPVLAACGDDATGPGAEFDATRAADAMVSMVTTAEALEDAFGSLVLAGPLFGEATAALVADGPVLSSGTAARYVEAPLAAPFFPSNVLGRTFAWDADGGRYVLTEAAGAPADGIRILYYAIDPFTHAPEADAQLGYIDLRDQSSPQSDRLAVRVVRTAGDAPVVLADYYIDGSWTATDGGGSVAVEALGSLSDGERQLQFDLRQSLMASETEVVIGQDFLMTLPSEDVEVRYVAELSGDMAGEQEATLVLMAAVAHDGQLVRFDATATPQALDGTIHYGAGGDAVLVATIGGTPGQPVFSDAAGNEVAPAELEALGVIFGALSGLFELVEGIFPPAA